MPATSIWLTTKWVPGSTSFRLTEAETNLGGEIAGALAFARAAAIAEALPCEGDEVSPADFRQHLAGVLTARALMRATERAGRT